MENQNIENKSTILNEEQVQNVQEGKGINDEQNEEVVLPSEEVDYQVPEKYQGKSAEELYKLMKKEEEYKNSQREEGGDNLSNNKEEEGVKEEEGKVSQNEITEMLNKVLEEGGEISEDIYKTLEEKGISKEEADTFYEGVQSKAEKEVSKTFEEAGITKEQFQNAGELARQNWEETRITEFNEAMNEAYASGNKTIQKALMRSLIDSTKGLPTDNAERIHTNSTPSQPRVEGYKTKSDYFSDVNNVRYRKDSSYRKIVEDKFLKTDRKNW